MSEDVLIEQRGRATWIKLNRPERKNCYDEDMAHTIAAAIRDAVRSNVIVITGSGDSFCAGGYLANLQEADQITMRTMQYNSLRLFDEIRRSPRPVIAAVNGWAVGGGNELVAACDLAIAAESAKLGQNGVRIGSAPVLGGTNVMTMLIGEKRGKEVSFLCRRYPAAEALEMGWINGVVPDAELEGEVERWCEELYKMSPRYLEIAKISSNVWWNQLYDSFLTGLGMLTQAVGSEDQLEGANAFMEKRQASFPQPADL